MSVLPEVQQANEAWVSGFQHGDKPMPPARKVAIVTCMDARLHPEKFLGFEVGDAHVIRNAGGRISDDAIRSLVISYRLLGTREFIVIHHSDCGMLTFSNDDLRAALRESPGADASSIDFLPFSDLEASVIDDVNTLKNSPLVPKDIPVSGFIYEVETGRIRRVI